MNATSKTWTKIAAVTALAVPAIVAAGPRPLTHSFVPGHARETRRALHAFHEALLESAGEDAEQAKVDADVVRTQGIRYLVAVDSILTSEQKTQILESLVELRRMKPEVRRASLQKAFAGVDESALRTALAAVKNATPANRPAAVEAAVQVVVDGVAPTLDSRYGITKAQRSALDAARTSFFDSTRGARVDLSVTTSENRSAAFASLSPSEQQTLADAKAQLIEKLGEILGSR